MSIQHLDGNDVNPAFKGKYTGTNPADFPPFSIQVELILSTAKVAFSWGKPLSIPNDREHRKGSEVTITEENLTADDLADGLKVGDVRLRPKQLKSYRDAVKSSEKEKRFAFALVQSLCQLDSPAEILTRRYKDNWDFDGMMVAMAAAGKSETMAVLLSCGTAIVNFMRGPSGKMGGINVNANMHRLVTNFHEVTHAVVKREAETDQVLADRLARSHVLLQAMLKYASIAILAKEGDHNSKFIALNIRESTKTPAEFDVVNLDARYDAMINALSQSELVQISELTMDKKADQKPKFTKKQRKAYNLYMNEMKAKADGLTNPPSNKKRKWDTKEDTREYQLCSYCNGRGHGHDHCFHNPGRLNKERPIPAGFVIKPKHVVINMMHIHHDAAAPSDSELRGMDDHQVIASMSIPLKSIILDGGSSHVVFNRFYKHLFVEFWPIEPLQIEGVAGETLLSIEAKGKVNFMGELIIASYCPLLRRSVISDGVLCKYYGMSIYKIGSICRVTNLRTNKQLVCNLSDTTDQYIIPETSLEEDHNGYMQSVSTLPNTTDLKFIPENAPDADRNGYFLASVRPANPRTLWHARFGHSHMHGIILMAKQKLYSDRGLKLPENLLKLNVEEDLCDSCAKGKPTISHKFIRHTRSEIKGKLWYFDVSGGGLIEPSLVYGNIYMMMFADSCTRMYWPYFTKRKDDKTILKILQKHYDEVILFCNLGEEEIIFYQSDNGELDTSGVKTWMKTKHALQRFTSPYSSSMNGMAERSFRSVRDLGLSMTMHAGLPPPYWQKACQNACLLLCIMPNQTADGWAREAYYLWTGLTFDYSLLRTWGSRCYAINHLGNKDFRDKSVEGILVGMKEANCYITTDYEIYLPEKNKFITTGDVLFCEHVGRKEPERLLPPILEIPKDLTALYPEDYEALIDTIHYDNVEGVQYKVLKVYVHKGLVVVDRVLFDPNLPEHISNIIDTVHLRDVLGYPIISGKTNVRYRPETPELSTQGSQPPRDMPVEMPPKIIPDAREEQLNRKRSTTIEQRSNVSKKAKSGRVGLRSSDSVQPVVDSLDENDSSWEHQISQMIMEFALQKECPSLFTLDEAKIKILQPNSPIEPRHHDAAMRTPESAMWRASELREIESLNKNQFAKVVDVPVGRKILNAMWVYTFKRDEEREVKLYKSRLVVRGDQAIHGVDYFLTFSPVTKLETIRIACALIIKLKMKPLQIDVNTAYVQSELEEDIYMWGIPGYPLPRGKCYKLLRSLYGLPQSGRNWNLLIIQYLRSIHFVQIREDLCLLILVIDGVVVALIALYVDDFLIGTDTEEREIWLLDLLNLRFDIKVIGLPVMLLGMTLKWTPVPQQRYFEKVKISNPKCVNLLLAQFQMTDCKPRNIPANPHTILSKSQCPTEEQRQDPEIIKIQKWYRTLVGSFIWLSSTVRVDIIHALLILSSFMSNPSYEHYRAALWTLQYLKGSIELGITYSIDGEFDLLGYVDADYGSHEDRKSVYSYLFMFAGGPISWKSGFESLVALSTAEAEVRAMHAMKEAVKHNLYLKKVFASLLQPEIAERSKIYITRLPMLIREDNRAAIRYVINPSGESSMKHIESDICWLHDHVADGNIKFEECASKDMLSDNGTKDNEFPIFQSGNSRIMS